MQPNKTCLLVSDGTAALDEQYKLMSSLSFHYKYSKNSTHYSELGIMKIVLAQPNLSPFKKPFHNSLVGIAKPKNSFRVTPNLFNKFFKKNSVWFSFDLLFDTFSLRLYCFTIHYYFYPKNCLFHPSYSLKIEGVDLWKYNMFFFRFAFHFYCVTLVSQYIYNHLNAILSRVVSLQM